MKSLCKGCLSAATVALLLAGPHQCGAQILNARPPQGGFQQPGMGGGPSPPGALPASPLAGGRAAAEGGSFVNVHGDPIVMPASYGGEYYGGQCSEGCYGDAGCQCGGYGGGAGGAYGDTGYVDFGGYGQDQCGPHYFDIMAGAVWLQADDAFGGVGPFGSIGVDGPRILDPEAISDEFEIGWQIAARIDLGPLSVLEGTYMGIYDIGASDTVRSVDVAPGGQDFQLFSAPGFGLPTPIPGLDDGSVYTLGYESDLQSTEFSYRRYWVGNSTRLSGTVLLGFRYVRLTEDLDFTAVALEDQVLLTTGTSVINWSGENDLLGFQTGADGWYTITQGLRVGAEGKAGIYNNRYDFTQTGDFSAAPGAPGDYLLRTKGDHVAFIGEGSVSVVADILPSWSLRAGYRYLYMDRLATVGSNIEMASLTTPLAATPDADAIYHGFDASLEFVW